MAAPHLGWPPRDILLAGALFLSLILLGVLVFVGIELYKRALVRGEAIRHLRATYARQVRKAIARALWRERMSQTPPAPPPVGEPTRRASPIAIRSGNANDHATLAARDALPPPLPDELDQTDPFPFDQRLTRPLRRPPDG